jgi:hypothetical protein
MGHLEAMKMPPPVISQEIRQPEAVDAPSGKALVEHEDVDMLPGRDITRQGLGDAAHAFALSVMTDPEWPIHNVVGDDCKAGDAVRFGGSPIDLQSFTQRLLAGEARQPVA